MNDPAAPTREVVIAPSRGLQFVAWRELFAYRDLLWLLVWRDFATRYKQTVLGPLWHLVQRGEALEVVARAYGVTIEQLVEWNRLAGTGIRTGQRLLVKPWT